VRLAKTDADGKFTVTGLPDYWEGLTAYVLQENGDFGTGGYSAMRPFGELPTDKQPPTPFLSVTIAPRNETLSLRLLTSEGTPQKNISVTLGGQNGVVGRPDAPEGPEGIKSWKRFMEKMNPVQKTDESGVVRFPHLVPGTYYVTNGHQMITGIPLYAGDNTVKTFRQPSSRIVTPIRLAEIAEKQNKDRQVQDNTIEWGHSMGNASGGGDSFLSKEGVFEYQPYDLGLSLLTFPDTRQATNPIQATAPSTVTQCLLPISYAFPLREPLVLLPRNLQTGTIIFTVQTHTGEPFAHQPFALGGHSAGMIGTTDGEGKITFNDIPPGEYYMGYGTPNRGKLSSGETVTQTIKMPAPPQPYVPSTSPPTKQRFLEITVLQPDGKTPAPDVSILLPSHNSQTNSCPFMGAQHPSARSRRCLWVAM
jgi:hypothetical protein